MKAIAALLSAAMLALSLLLPAPLLAHESRPALLEIEQAKDGTVMVRFRQPTASDGTGIRLEPHLSSGWLDRPADQTRGGEAALERTWRIAAPAAPLAGQSLRIDGLESTITDAMVTITGQDGKRQTLLLNAAMPATVLGGSAAGWGWVRLGFDHILGGWDHLAFVLGMVLLVIGWRPLLWALTTFTLAHSLTLALASLGLIHVPGAPVEAAIALSVAVLAMEVLRQQSGQPGWLNNRPWALAFPFGLLHGLGFAGALGDLGLDADNVLWPLLGFNLGVELGQIAFVAVLLAAGWLLGRVWPKGPDLARRWLPYALGPLAMFWFFERLLAT